MVVVVTLRPSHDASVYIRCIVGGVDVKPGPVAVLDLAWYTEIMLYLVKAVGTNFYRLNRSDRLDTIGPLVLELVHVHEGGEAAKHVLEREMAHARIGLPDWYRLEPDAAAQVPDLMRRAHALSLKGRRMLKTQAQRKRRERVRPNTTGFRFEPT